MIKEEKFITLRDKTKLYAQVKEIGSPIWLIGVHGIGEHLGRHQYLPKLFGSDFNILQYDHRGHGKSEGKRGYIEDFFQFMHDLKEVVSFLQSTYKMQRYIIYGHSMGAMVVSGFLQELVDPKCYPERVFMSAPPVGVPGVLPTILKWAPPLVAESLAKTPVSFQMGGTIDLKKLSHDIRVYEDYITDELNITKPHFKLLAGLIDARNKIYTRPLRLKCPGYMAVGSEDIVVDAKAAVDYFTQIEKSVHVKLLEGAYHEMHNEISKYRDPYFEFLKDSLLSAAFREEAHL